jgi:hypothetical protein
MRCPGLAPRRYPLTFAFRLAPEEIAYWLNDSGGRMLFVDETFVETVLCLLLPIAVTEARTPRFRCQAPTFLACLQPR